MELEEDDYPVDYVARRIDGCLLAFAALVGLTLALVGFAIWDYFYAP